MNQNPQQNNNHKSVLVIDDDKWFHSIINRYLVEDGYSTINALDATEGLNKAINSKPTLIILDIFLPDFRGDFLLKIIKKLDMTNTIPVIIVSSGLSVEILAAALKDGANGFLSKPISEDSLKEKIEEVLTKLKNPINKKSN